MGSSPSIAQLQKQQEQVQTYIDSLKTQLNAKAANIAAEMQTEISSFYNGNGWTYKNFISGASQDFQQVSEFTFDNVKKIVDAISSAVFGNEGKLPEGVTVDTKALGPAVQKNKNLQLYIAQEALSVLSGIVLSFGSSTEVSYTQAHKSAYLSNGMQLFASVSMSTYKASSFLNHETISQYLYRYDVKYSLDQAQATAQMELQRMYSDQVATFTEISEGLLAKLSAGQITAAQYASSAATYQGMIDQSNKMLQALT